MSSSAVTVVVPCYEEQSNVPSLVARLAALAADGGRWWEFVFVDDGSRDGTLAALHEGVRALGRGQVLHHPRNRGVGAALRTGFAVCATPVVCTIDSDCSYPPERLADLVALVDQGADVATASAWHPSGGTTAESPLRVSLSRAVSRLYRGLLGVKLHTFTSLCRAYRREILAGLVFHSDGFASQAEILVRALLDGRVVRELPVALEPRRQGASKLRIGPTVVAHGLLLGTTALRVLARSRRSALGAPAKGGSVP